jgi:hypothetical protein
MRMNHVCQVQERVGVAAMPTRVCCENCEFGSLEVGVFQLLSAQHLICCVAIALHAATAEELTANFAAAAEIHARGAAASSASGLGRVRRTEACGTSVQVENICQANHADEAS